jgi:hypothetical protein
VIDVVGMSGKLDVIAPVTWLAGHATVAGDERDRRCVGSAIRVRLS